jgi:Putative adhesin
VIDDSSSALQVVPGHDHGIKAQRWLSGTAAQPGHSSWTLHGNTLQLGIDCSGLVFSCGSRFQVAVPPGMTVTVNSGSNTVTVSDLSAPVTVNGNQGGVNVTGVAGPLQVSTGSGSVAAKAVRSTAVQVTTSQGSADISFAAAPRSVTVRCSTGSATVRVPAVGHRYHVLVSSGTGSASSKVPDDPQAGNVVQVSSVNGDAAVLPAP